MALPILIDSCFWIALFDSRDQDHQKAVDLWKNLSSEPILVPWPTLYETISTRMVRRATRIDAVKSLFKSTLIEFLDDQPYRERALRKTFDFEVPPCSLTDRLIREVLSDKRLLFQAFITFNRIDFEDVCQERRIEIFP